MCFPETPGQREFWVLPPYCTYSISGVAPASTFCCVWMRTAIPFRYDSCWRFSRPGRSAEAAHIHNLFAVGGLSLLETVRPLPNVLSLVYVSPESFSCCIWQRSVNRCTGGLSRFARPRNTLRERMDIISKSNRANRLFNIVHRAWCVTSYSR